MRVIRRIGIDFGGVIVKPANDDRAFNPAQGALLEQEHAIDCVAKLIRAQENEVWVISKASRSTQAATRMWFDNVKFYQRTGFLAAHLLFCSKRSEKRKLCEQLKITHFIDDSYDVLTSLSGAVENLYLFGHRPALNGIHSAQDWKQLIQYLEVPS